SRARTARATRSAGTPRTRPWAEPRAQRVAPHGEIDAGWGRGAGGRWIRSRAVAVGAVARRWRSSLLPDPRAIDVMKAPACSLRSGLAPSSHGGSGGI